MATTDSARGPDMCSPLEGDQRWELALRITRSSHFRKSARHRELLLYLCERALSGHPEEKERTSRSSSTSRKAATFQFSGDPALSSSRSRNEVITKYFDTSLASVNQVGTFGNSPRNFLRNVRFFNVDASLQKNFAITERYQLLLRGEFFNMFNNVHLNQPGTNVSSKSTFGRITSAGSPRILQFGAKIIF